MLELRTLTGSVASHFADKMHYLVLRSCDVFPSSSTKSFSDRSLLLILLVHKWNMGGAADILHDKRYVSPCLPPSIFKASFKVPVDNKLCDFHCGYLWKPKCDIQAPQVSALTPRIAKTLAAAPQGYPEALLLCCAETTKTTPEEKAGRNPIQLLPRNREKELGAVAYV